MEVYIIANIRNSRNHIKGYRLLDIEGKYTIKDVTKEQLIYVMKHKGFKVENAKVTNGKVMGTYYALDSIVNIICDDSSMSCINMGSQINNKLLILKVLMSNNKATGAIIARADGEVKVLGVQETIKLINQNIIINSSNINDIKCKRENITENIGISTKALTYVSKQNTYGYISDEEALDKNIVWDMKRFMQYMNQRGFYYEVRTSEGGKLLDIDDINEYTEQDGYIIQNIDIRCSIIHLPFRTRKINFIYNIDENDYDTFKSVHIDLLIIPSSITIWNEILNKQSTILSMCANKYNMQYKDIRLINIDNLWFQTDANNQINLRSKLTCLKSLTINNEYNLPGFIVDDTNKLYEAFKYCTLPYIVDFKATNKKIALTSCFNECIIKADKILINASIVFNSFNGVLTNHTVIIDENSEDIISSFNDNAKSSLTLDLTQAKNLQKIENSFRSCDIKGKLDLYDCTRLADINGSFCSASSITELRLPINLRRIIQGSFKSVKIKEITYPESVRCCGMSSFNENVKINYPKSFGDILTREIVGMDVMGDIVVPKIFKHIGCRAFASSCIFTLNNSEHIVSIDRNAFTNSMIKRIDYTKLPLVKIIEESTFEDCTTLSEVIISKNILEIKDCAFNGCKRLSKILISDSVKEIGKDVFKGCNAENDGLLVAYVVKNSKAHTKYKNHKKISCITFDNYEDAYSAFCRKNLSDESQQAKFKLISSTTTEFDALKKEPYLKNCMAIMRLCKLAQQETSPYEENIDESIFDFNGALLDNYDKLKEMKKLIQQYISKIEFKYNGKYTKQFAGYIKLLNTLSNGNNHFITKDNVEEVFKMVSITEHDFLNKGYDNPYIYVDPRCQILRFNCRKIRAMFGILLIVVIVDSRIVWSTLCYTDIKETCISENKSFLNPEFYVNNQNTHNYNMAQHIMIGDTYKNCYNGDYVKTSIDSMQLPDEEIYSNIWRIMMDTDLVYLGVSDISRFNKYDSEMSKKITEILMYSLQNNKIYAFNMKVSQIESSNSRIYNSIVISTLYSAKVKDIIDLDLIQKACKKYAILERLISYFNSKHLEIIKETFNNSEELLEDLKNKSDAYDYESIMHKDGLVEALGNSTKGVYDENKLNEAQLKAILNIGLCKETDLTFSELFKKGLTPEMKPIPGSDKVLIEFPYTSEKGAKRTNVNYYYTIKSLTDSGDTKGIYQSYFSIRNLLAFVNGLNMPLVDEETHIIDNKPINTDDFIFILTCTDCCRYGDYTKYYIALQKQTFECFIIADDDDMYYYKIFRFKNFIEADDFLFEFSDIESGIDRDVFINSLSRLLHSIKSNMRSDFGKDFVSLLKLRELIMDGMPNNYNIQSIYLDVFRKLAKQPKI